jgi:hypothetical protein
MRVATANSYDSTVNTLNKRQAELSAQQDRISTGKRVQRASDDPVAAVMAEAAQNRLSRAQVDQRAVEASRTSLSQAESALGNAGELIQDVRELFLKAGNATYGSKEFQSIAQEIEGLRERMLGVANQKDSAGRTLFGGLGGTATPFVEAYGPSGGGVRFDGQRGQEAAGNNSLPQTFDGETVFMRVPPGNGTFTLDLPAGNTGGLHTDVGGSAILGPHARLQRLVCRRRRHAAIHRHRHHHRHAGGRPHRRALCGGQGARIRRHVHDAAGHTRRRRHAGREPRHRPDRHLQGHAGRGGSTARCHQRRPDRPAHAGARARAHRA